MLGLDVDTVSPLKVRHRVRQMLSGMSDLSMSQKDIYRRLEAELGKPLCTVGKGVVKEEIEMFLLDRASQPQEGDTGETCLLYTSPSPRDISGSRMPSSA